MIPPFSADVKSWAEAIRRYLAETRSRMDYKRQDANATQDGVILWDHANGYPVVAKSGVWRRVALDDGGIPKTVVEVNDTTFNTPTANGFHILFDACYVTIPHDDDLDLPVGTELQFCRGPNNSATTITIGPDAFAGNWIHWLDGYANIDGEATIVTGIAGVATLIKGEANLWYGRGDLNPVP